MSLGDVSGAAASDGRGGLVVPEAVWPLAGTEFIEFWGLGEGAPDTVCRRVIPGFCADFDDGVGDGTSCPFGEVLVGT